MPRDGSGVYSKPAGTTAVPNTTIESAKYNSTIDDLVADANTARPIVAGGTGATTAIASGDAFSTKGADIASAATTDIGAATGRFVHITGTTTITSFGTKTAGVLRVLTFDGALTITHNATSLILPGAANIGTSAGDTAVFVSEGGGNWRCVSYSNLSGAYATKSGNYTAVGTDNGTTHRYTAAATASLTAAATLGLRWTYTIIADGGAVTIDPNGSETIGGLTTQIVPNGSAATIICDGSNFFFTYLPTGWRAIRTVSFSAASAIDMTDLGQYSRLRITGFMTTSGATALLWRTSTNNGSSYDSGASDYSYQAIGAANTTLSGARSTASNSGLISAASLNQAHFTFTLDAFNNASYGAHGLSSCMVGNSGTPELQIIGGFRLTAAARNALRILPSAAVTMTGNLILEGALV